MTICHGDFRVDNLMFDDRAGRRRPVAVLDWQISYRGPAISDVAYFLCQSLTVEERRAHETALVRGLVRRAGVTARSSGDWSTTRSSWRWDQYRRADARHHRLPRHGRRRDGPRQRARPRAVLAMAARSFTAALDLDAADLLPV